MSAPLERRALDERLLDEVSRAIAARLFARFPELRALAAMERSPERDALGRTCASLLEASDRDELIDELTTPGSRGEARLRSWSGRLDRRVTLAELDAEDPR